MKVIQYNLDSWDYELRVWVSDSALSLDELTLQYDALSWVNGVFFCPSDYSECNWYSFTINERYIQGDKIGIYEDTGERVVYGWTEENYPLLFQTGKINADKESLIFEGFANYPLLLKDGENMLEHYYDYGLIDIKMRTKWTRNFICNDEKKGNIYFWLVYNVNLDELAHTLREFWCYDALNLDAGKSTAFIYNGRYLVWPWRDILDGLLIVRRDLKTSEIDEKARLLSERIFEIISEGRTLKKRFLLLEKLDERLALLRQKIYEKNSEDLFDWEENIGYKIDITNIKTLEKVYLINALQKYNKGLLENIEAEIKLISTPPLPFSLEQ